MAAALENKVCVVTGAGLLRGHREAAGARLLPGQQCRAGGPRPFEQITPEQMDRIMRVNVHGTLYCAQAAVPSLRALQDGRIINFSSKSGKAGSALMAHCSAAKGAIIALTRIEDVVDFVHFLTVSAGHCTGQSFNITGGRELH